MITENRLSAAEFLGDAAIEHVLQPRADLGTVLDPAQYTSPEAALAAWVPVFFPELPVPTDVSAKKVSRGAGGVAQAAPAVCQPDPAAQGQVISLHDLQQQMQGPLPESARTHIRLVLDACWRWWPGPWPRTGGAAGDVAAAGVDAGVAPHGGQSDL